MKARTVGELLLRVLLCTRICGPAWSAEASPTVPPLIEVSGQGELTLDPDHATVQIAIETNAGTAAQAAQDNARIEKTVREALLQAGAAGKDLTTAGYVVEPQWQYHEGTPPRRTGYLARNTLRVDVTVLARAGPFVDAALAAGASRVDNVAFDLKDSDAAHRQALALAVANARSDAEVLAKAAGGGLGALRELSTTSAAERPGMFQQVTVSASRVRAAEPTDILPAPIRVSAVVLGRWEFLPRP